MQETNTLITNISQAEVESLENSYSFTDRQKVLNFIDENPFLMPLLLEAPAKIAEYFQNAKLQLELEIDPEVADFVELFLIIITDLDVDAAMDKLDQLDDQWWLDISPQAETKLCIDIGFS